MRKIIRRIEREVGVPDLSGILGERIKPTDLQSLLLEVYKAQVKRRNPSAVFSDYISSIFSLPSPCDPELLLELDRVAFSHLPEGFYVLELSPVSPLGSVSCIAPISQDWVFTNIRNTEVVADATNILALECARQRQEIIRSDPTSATAVHLACSHRVVRAQRFRGAGQRQHFRLFLLYSAGRSTRNLRFEYYTMTRHVQFYLKALRDFLWPSIPIRVAFIDLAPDSRTDEVFKALVESLRGEFDDVDTSLEKTQNRGTWYYCKLRFHVSATSPKGKELELVDGGDTNWTQKLLNNAKERLVISGIGSERLCENFGPLHRHSYAQTKKGREMA